MKIKSVWLMLAVIVLTISAAAHAQQPAAVRKIGFLGVRLAASGTGFELLVRELGALGYVEGTNLSIEFRSAEDKAERLPALADELVRLKVDVIVTPATQETRAARKATGTIPIVGLNLGDPVKLGLVDSFARPGGNITGFTVLNTELAGKRLEILKETVPKVSRVAVLWNRRDSASQWEEIPRVGRALGLQLHSMEVNSAEGFASAFKAAGQSGSGALAVTTGPFILSYQKRVVELAAQNRLPAIYPRQDFVASGGLMSYSADESERFKRVAVFIDKILKGAKPADLPVEQPTKFEFVVNLKTAKQISLTIPPNVLARADRVIR